MMSTTEFADKYFEMWKTTDEAKRQTLGKELFIEDAIHYAVPANIKFEGRDAILINIARINAENIQKVGLQFQVGSITPNHNAIQIEWAVAAPNGAVVGTGRDFLVLNNEGKVITLHMFNG